MLRTKENTYIQVNDFKQQPFVLDVGEGFYNLDGANADINLPYSILYNQNNQSFAISLNIAPLYTTRDQATAEFIKRLGITSEQACKINIYVGVPYSVDSRLSGQNLGLSYCPGNVPL